MPVIQCFNCFFIWYTKKLYRYKKKYRNCRQIKILQWNMKGVFSNLENLGFFLSEYEPDLLLLSDKSENIKIVHNVIESHFL